MDDLPSQWLAQAKYDLSSAEVMLKARKYLYVAFMCQQSMEKILKAIIQKRKNETPPYTHKLSILIKMIELEVSEQDLDFLDSLTRYYINCRYPEHKQKLAKELDKKGSQELLKRTKECFSWLKKELKI